MIRAHPVDVLLRVGGTAGAADLVALCGRPGLRRALRDGTVLRIARGRYALPETTDPRLAAARVKGVVSHTSAALHWCLAVMRAPERPHVTIDPRRGRVDAGGWRCTGRGWRAATSSTRSPARFVRCWTARAPWIEPGRWRLRIPRCDNS